MIADEQVTVRLYRYKDHAERFASRFAAYANVRFELVDDYAALMEGADVVFSSVTFAEHDFCPASSYKPGCTVIPVHMRGFMGCDLSFDHVITSDLTSIKKFANYAGFKRLSLINDVIYRPELVRNDPSERVIVYNLGISLYDLHFASNILPLVPVAQVVSI
jgi:ornithine cyclodeaminase/alanine dehydrogenase-like protein (mu-crystallin family)